MKRLIALFPTPLLCATGLALSLISGLGADTNSTTSQATAAQPSPAPETPSVKEAAAPKLPYGVEDVLKLSRAQVSDDVVLSYIRNAGTIYNLSPQDIVYLRNQGVPDRIVNAMLDQRKRVTEVAAQPAPTQPSPAIPNAPTVPDAYQAPPPPDYTQVAPQAAPPPSTVYVVPSPTVNPYYYPYYGYYGPYYYPYYRGYYGPTLSFGFRFGGHGYGSGHRGWHHR